MHEIEPFYNWRHIYTSEDDEKSPFFNQVYSEFEYVNSVYNYCIHPQWDSIGSETLYLKLIFCDYQTGFCIIEFIGEWNDALHNDIMHLKRNLLDELSRSGVNKFLLIGEQVMNFHSDTDDYYSEWFDELEDGWIVAVGFFDHVIDEWNNVGISNFIFFGEWFNDLNWRTKTPVQLLKIISQRLSNLLS